jgi:hypothetical protein
MTSVYASFLKQQNQAIVISGAVQFQRVVGVPQHYKTHHIKLIFVWNVQSQILPVKNLLVVLFSLVVGSAVAQPNLKPSIGLGSLPADNTPVCAIPTYQGSFTTSGYQEGDTIPDFTLYTVGGTAVNIKSVLQSKKPVLLVNGNYTCPVYRGKLPDLNAMAAFYGSALNTYIVYTVEAHPIIDNSPYSGNVWVTSQNQTDGVLYRQPKTYGERKALIDTMKKYMTITPTILVDGPCNEWWSYFGPAPNNAYLIDTNGIVQAKHAWFHKLPDNMWCDIDTLLGTNSGNCIAVPNNGNFSFKLDKDSVIAGPAGNVLALHGVLKNTSATGSVTVQVMKMQKAVPAGWETALCADICYATNIDTAYIMLAPADSQSFTFYFYTDTIAGSGNVTVGFRNMSNSNNKMKQGFYATTWGLDINEVSTETVRLYPNPVSDRLHIHLNDNEPSTMTLIDVAGRVVQHYPERYWQTDVVLPVGELPAGIYLLKIESRSRVVNRKVVVQR